MVPQDHATTATVKVTLLRIAQIQTAVEATEVEVEVEAEDQEDQHASSASKKVTCQETVLTRSQVRDPTRDREEMMVVQ